MLYTGRGVDMGSKKREISATFINNIVSTMGKKTNNFVLVKHYGEYSLDQEDARNAMIAYNNIEVFYAHFANNEMVGSFEPFLGIIKNFYTKYYSDITIDEYLAEFDIYKLQKSFLKSYIDSGTCERYEPYILDEIEFEKKKIVESVANVITVLSKKCPILIIVDNVHMVPKNTLTLLKYLIDKPENANIGFIGAYNELKHVTSVTSALWKEYVNIIASRGGVFEGGSHESKENEEDSSEFVFDSQRAYEYLLKLSTMYCAVGLEQADYYLQKIYEKLSNERMSIDFDCKFKLLKLYAQVLINSGDFATALLICDNIKEMCEIDKSLNYEYDYYSLHAYTQIYIGKGEYAKKSANKCRTIALQMGDKDYIFRADMLMHMVEMSGWHNIYFLTKDFEISEEFIEKIEEYGYYNHLAYIYIYAYDNDFKEYLSIKTIEEFEKKLARFHEGMDLAENLGNKCLIQKAYRKVIMMTSAIGLFNITDHYYQEYIDLLGDSDEVELADVKNGQGYINCASRKFEKANDCYNMSIDIFMARENVKAVGETLYNMSMNCILAGDFNSALNYLKVCIRVVEKMRLNDLRVCNIAKLYGLIALCCVRLSFEYDSIFYLKTCKKFVIHIINKCTYRDDDKVDRAFTGNDDELFLFYFVSGLLDAKNGKYQEALDNYEVAYEHCLNSEGNMFFSYVQLKVAMADVYKALDDKDNAEKMIDDAYAFAEKMQYTDQMEKIKEMRETGQYVQENAKLPLKNHTLEKINELIERSCVTMQYHDLRTQMEFVSIWQNILEINDKTKSELIKTAGNAFMLNFNLDSFLYIKYHEHSAEVLFSDGSVTLTEKNMEILREYFESTKTGFVTAKINKNYDDYKKVLKVFGTDIVCSMICSPYFVNEKLDSLFISCIYMKTNWSIESYRFLLSESEADIFNLLLRQMLIAIEKIENINEIRHINDALKRSSVTDHLTGLRNRNGFYERVNKLIEVNKEQKTPLHLSILYIDLDNFKYYNDTFGHDVGDLVLKEISHILTKSSEEDGFAVRYGGDEFLIVLENSSKEGAIATARMTLDSILLKNGYVSEISDFLGKQVSIPIEKTLSCSIGVAVSDNICSDKELAELIKCADSSLYSVKHTTKKAVKFYEG